jgi:FtsH-binding integral membrane protein
MYKEYSERTFFSKIYFNMTWALALTALVAYGISIYPPFVTAIFNNMAGLFILMLLEVVLVAVLSGRVMNMSVGAAYAGLIVFALINGRNAVAHLSRIHADVHRHGIRRGGGLFLVMALFGYTTKKDCRPGDGF